MPQSHCNEKQPNFFIYRDNFFLSNEDMSGALIKYPRRDRPVVLKGSTYRFETPFGTAYITVNKTENDNEPFELFLNVGKGGSDLAAISEGYGRLVSWILRSASDMSPTERLQTVATQLENIGGQTRVRNGHDQTLSLPDALAKAIRLYLSPVDIDKTALDSSEKRAPGGQRMCPTCHNYTMIPEQGCWRCVNCQQSQC